MTAEQQGQIASYADFGAWVDVAAPGTSVVYLGTQPWYVVGTSVSTAYITGLAAGAEDSTHQSWPTIESAISKSYPMPAQ